MKSKIPILPILNLSYFSDLLKSNSIHKLIDSPNFVLTRNGRSAIYLALQAEGIESGCEVLMPAYHCPSMVEAVIAAGAKPVFYKLNEDLSVDVKSFTDSCGRSTKAALVTHYFGIPQAGINQLKDFCETSGLVLIEDCAHLAFYNLYSGNVGRIGDYVILSLRKFFPIHDGGALISNKPIQPLSNHLSWDIRSTYNMLHEATIYKRLPILSPLFYLSEQLKKLRQSQQTVDDNFNSKFELDKPAKAFKYVDEETLSCSISRISKVLVGAVDPVRIKKKRRDNCAFIANSLTNSPLASNLFPLGDNELIPYMIPISFKHASKVYASLRDMNYPVWRWDDLYTDVCHVSNHFGKSILQIPCHQDLNENELNYLLNGLGEFI